ncbi:hypothetical protein [Amycolatopsis sp. lyj-346]|uniref:hypothetical protein n=1 Tax=Amycolatopsis sp. lyj-346 TaxID=2789289 RepID=UPI0039791CD8
MTALDDRPTNPNQPRGLDPWEWHEFDADGWAHLYRVAELDNRRLELLLPWCLLRAPFPLEHDRASISQRVVTPQRGRTCPACAAHVWARVPHPRAGSPAVGEFAGDLYEVVTRDARA